MGLVFFRAWSLVCSVGTLPVVVVIVCGPNHGANAPPLRMGAEQSSLASLTALRLVLRPNSRVHEKGPRIRAPNAFWSIEVHNREQVMSRFRTRVQREDPLSGFGAKVKPEPP